MIIEFPRYPKEAISPPIRSQRTTRCDSDTGLASATTGEEGEGMEVGEVGDEEVYLVVTSGLTSVTSDLRSPEV